MGKKGPNESILGHNNIENWPGLSEATYRDLVENVNSIILRFNRSGDITFINKYAQHFFGYSDEEIIGKSIIGTIVPAKESSGRDLSNLTDDIVANPGAYVHNENENITKNGDTVWISWTNRPITDNNGQIIEILSVGNDITDRKIAEDRLRNTLQELAEAKERAVEADRIKSAFLATMSHELRTPLNSIIGFTSIILQGLIGPLNDEQKKQLGIVRDSARHLLSLINDVLDISKIEAGQLQIAQEQFDLRATMKRVVESAHPMAEKKGLSITWSLAPGIETMTGDHRRIEQILINLVGNAIKFTEKGFVEIVGEEEEDWDTIRVSDTGIGIRAEDMEILFKPFQQIDSGITRKYEGTGLGLSVCKGLAELMGGKIRVTSVLGFGSTFYFSLPKIRKDA